jgi:hypothetical protein
MTIGGALSELNNLLKSDDIPFYYKPSIKAVMDTIALSNSEKPNKWIPVSERLPEDEQEVQITYKINNKHHVWSAIWDKLHGRFYDKEYRSYISLNYVKAWMPLPTPYEPMESEEV